jgi:hypothetical protein
LLQLRLARDFLFYLMTGLGQLPAVKATVCGAPPPRDLSCACCVTP